MAAVLPENRSAAFGTDDRVVRVLQHQDTISHSNPECPAGPTFSDHHRDGRSFQRHHLAEIHGYCLGDGPLLRSDSWIGSRSIDESNERHSELLRQPHQAKCLPVTLRMCAAEVTLQVFLGVATFLVA